MSTVRTDRARTGGSGSAVVPPPQPGPRDRAWWSRAFADLRVSLSSAVGAVLLGVVACVGLVVAAWAGDPDSGTAWPQAVRLGVDLWLVTHLGQLDVVSQVVTSVSPVDPPTEVAGTLSLAPLGLTLLAASLAWRAGRRAARRTAPVRALLLCLPLAATYAGAAWAFAWLVDTAVVAPAPTASAIGAGALAAVAAAAGALGVHARALGDRLPRTVAVQLGRVLPAAGVALTAWLLGGAVLLSVGLLLQLPQVTEVHGALGPGVVGGFLLLLVQVAYLPTAVVWSASLLAGPGARVGEGHVTLSGSTVLDVPAVPLLAGLPAPGPFPLWAYLGPLLVVLAGAAAGWHAHRHPSSRGATLGDRLGDAVAVAALTGTAAAGLVRAASGSLGPWQPLGPDLLLVVGAVTAQVLIGALLVGGALHLLSGRPLSRVFDRSGGASSRPVNRSGTGLRSGRPGG